MLCHPSAQITALIQFTSPKLALDFIKGLDKDADAMAVDAPTNTDTDLTEAAPPADAAPAETEAEEV
jgi:hypothetical protein